MDQAAIDRIHTSFDAQSLMTTFGATLSEVSAGHICVTAPILPLALQQQGFGHAGLTFAHRDVLVEHNHVVGVDKVRD